MKQWDKGRGRVNRESWSERVREERIEKEKRKERSERKKGKFLKGKKNKSMNKKNKAKNYLFQKKKKTSAQNYYPVGWCVVHLCLETVFIVSLVVVNVFAGIDRLKEIIEGFRCNILYQFMLTLTLMTLTATVHYCFALRRPTQNICLKFFLFASEQYFDTQEIITSFWSELNTNEM